MIIIEEKNCVKLSGITSLFLTFPFNQEAINIIKSCDKYVFDKKTYAWELPINCLAYLLDNLTYVDDITLKLKNEDVLISYSTKESEYPEWLIQIIKKLY